MYHHKNSYHDFRLSTISHFVYQILWKALMTRNLIKVRADDSIKKWIMISWPYSGKYIKKAHVTVALNSQFCVFATVSYVRKMSIRHLLHPCINTFSSSHPLGIHPWLKLVNSKEKSLDAWGHNFVEKPFLFFYIDRNTDKKEKQSSGLKFPHWRR